MISLSSVYCSGWSQNWLHATAANIKHFLHLTIAPVDDHTIVPVDDHTIAPVDDHTIVPVDDHTIVPVDDHRLLVENIKISSSGW